MVSSLLHPINLLTYGPIGFVKKLTLPYVQKLREINVLQSSSAGEDY